MVAAVVVSVVVGMILGGGASFYLVKRGRVNIDEGVVQDLRKANKELREENRTLRR